MSEQWCPHGKSLRDCGELRCGYDWLEAENERLRAALQEIAKGRFRGASYIAQEVLAVERGKPTKDSDG